MLQYMSDGVSTLSPVSRTVHCVDKERRNVDGGRDVAADYLGGRVVVVEV